MELYIAIIEDAVGRQHARGEFDVLGNAIEWARGIWTDSPRGTHAYICAPEIYTNNKYHKQYIWKDGRFK